MWLVLISKQRYKHLHCDISNICYKSKQFSYNFTVYDHQMEALGDVHCYLWYEGEGNQVPLKQDHAYCSTGCAGSFL